MCALSPRDVNCWPGFLFRAKNDSRNATNNADSEMKMSAFFLHVLLVC